jgi:5'-nucleotidase
LVVSGVNFGANVSIEVTISGTVGAALEAAAFGIPALAVSLEMDPAYHLTGNDATDFTATKAFVWRFARQLLTYALPYDVDVLSVNIPADATPRTPWRLTHLSRRRYFAPQPPVATGRGGPAINCFRMPHRPRSHPTCAR